MDFFKDNAAKTEADTMNKIDRYISWPRQALGSRFDVRDLLEAPRQRWVSSHGAAR